MSLYRGIVAKQHPKVYLAGTIGGLSFGDANDWRKKAVDELGWHGIIGASPMRFKDHLEDTDILSHMGYDKNVMSTQKGIISRDRYDVLTCDVILCNLESETNRISIGTVMEIAWANHLHKPVIAIMKEGNPHEHAMLSQCIDFRVDTVAEAIDVAKRILLYEPK
jgi:nucleoside 2-deoxyribosyltransferase